MIWLGFVIAVGSLCLFGGLTFVFSDFLAIVGYTPGNYAVKIDSFGIYLVYIIISCLAPAFFEALAQSAKNPSSARVASFKTT